MTGAGAANGFPPKAVSEECGGSLPARAGSLSARPVGEAGAALRPAPVGTVGRARLAIALPSRRRAGLTHSAIALATEERARIKDNVRRARIEAIRSALD